MACFWVATSLEKIYRQPRGRVNGHSRHGRIWQFMRQNMNSPASADYRIELRYRAARLPRAVLNERQQNTHEARSPLPRKEHN